MGQPDLNGFFAQVVGDGRVDFGAIYWAGSAVAAGITFGGNPPYQIADFFAIYPQFGTWKQGISSVTISAVGIEYQVGDVVGVTQDDASGAQLRIASVDTNGEVLTLAIANKGSGYSVANALPTMGGTGTGLLVNVTAIDAYSGKIPQAVLQMYVNLAAASLSHDRWQEWWPIGMALFIAHFATLYLRSVGAFLDAGSPDSATAQQIAAQGMAKGIMVSKSAGDVSATYETLKELDCFASWTTTEFGQQLATHARVIGSGPIWIG